MADDVGRRERDDFIDPDDEGLSQWSRARREQRFWHRESRETKRLLQAAEHHDLSAAQQITADIWQQTKSELLARDSFAPVFFLTVVVVIGTPLFEASLAGRLFTTAILVVTLLLALQRSLLYRRSLIRAAWTMGVALALTGLALVGIGEGDDPWILEATVSFLYVLIIAVAMPSILIRTLLHPKVTLNTLAGVMTAFLFIGLMFTGVFRFIDATTDGDFFAQEETVLTGDFEYFSFITLTTTGYGDLTPGSQAARAAAMAEAIVGQVFLVTVVARVVAMFGQTRRIRLPEGDGPPTLGDDRDPSEPDDDP